MVPFFLWTLRISLTIYSIFLICYFPFDNIFFLTSFFILSSIDILSIIFPNYYFQLLFFFTLLVYFIIFAFNFQTIQCFFLFFYSFFKTTYYIYFYNFIFLFQKKDLKIFNYLNNLPDVKDETIECYICLENCNEQKHLKYLHCSHTFHPVCLSKWFSEKKFDLPKKYKCPVCSRSIFPIKIEDIV